MIVLWLAGVLGTGAEMVRINEIRVDQPGPDEDQYFELEGPGRASLDGLTYVVIGDAPATGSGTIEQATNLSAHSLDADGLILVGEGSAVLCVFVDVQATLAFENCDNVTHLLVTGFSGILLQDLDFDDDCVLDVTPWESVVDVVALIVEENPPLKTECHYGPPVIGPGVWQGGDCPDFKSGLGPGHVYRCGATGEWVVGDHNVALDTPGGPNPPCRPCAGDVVTDDIVNVLDLVAVILAWGTCDPSADVNDDGTVNVQDLVVVITAWGPC